MYLHALFIVHQIGITLHLIQSRQENLRVKNLVHHLYSTGHPFQVVKRN